LEIGPLQTTTGWNQGTVAIIAGPADRQGNAPNRLVTARDDELPGRVHDATKIVAIRLRRQESDLAARVEPVALESCPEVHRVDFAEGHAKPDVATLVDQLVVTVLGVVRAGRGAVQADGARNPVLREVRIDRRQRDRAVVL